MTARSGGAGSVVAYNFMDDQFINGQEHWQEIGLNGSHAAGSHGMLFEGNQVSNMDSDDTHGNAIDHVFFRNWATGVRTPFTDYISGVVIDDAKNLPGGNGPLRAAGVMAYTYWMAFVGNVLGTSGVTTAANGWVLNGSFAGPKKAASGCWVGKLNRHINPIQTARLIRSATAIMTTMITVCSGTLEPRTTPCPIRSIFRQRHPSSAQAAAIHGRGSRRL